MRKTVKGNNVKKEQHVSSITSVCTVRVLIIEVGVIFACWGALNASGNMSFFKSYQLVAVLMAECEPHLSNDWAVLTVIPVSREHTGTDPQRHPDTHPREGRTKESRRVT